MTDQQADTQLDRYVRTHYSPLLHNVNPNGPHLCAVCRLPLNPQEPHERCPQCEGHVRQAAAAGAALADDVAFLTYAVEGPSVPTRAPALSRRIAAGRQVYSVLYGYKNPDRGRMHRSFNDMFAWVTWVLRHHANCVGAMGARPETVSWQWATVPSVRSIRGGDEHPLHRIVRQALSGRSEAVLTVTDAGLGAGQKTRHYDPAMFRAEVKADRVLLVDDSWATGANVQSAASALKRAGARHVAALVVGRLLRPAGWPPALAFLTKHAVLDQPFDWSLCPWTGVPHSS
ncbi:MAG: phosphoribosyltransferase [Bifidobacteriaceae bacterium]|jgi:hypothetical protein|nr:phosphoribosyltransferase [Bifidobacteriaceae bacterium]